MDDTELEEEFGGKRQPALFRLDESCIKFIYKNGKWIDITQEKL